MNNSMTVLASAALACAVLETSSRGQSAPQEVMIELGGSYAGTLTGPSSLARIGLVVEHAGPVIVSAESFDFDAVLEILDSAERQIVRADLGGVGADARGEFTARPGVGYTIVVSSAEPLSGGDFVVRADSERADPARDAGLEYWIEAAERASKRHDERRQLACLLKGGRSGFELGRFAEARPLLGAALPIADALGDERARLECLAFLGAALQTEDLDQAREHLSRAREGMRGAPGHELARFVLERLAQVHQGLSEFDEARQCFEDLLASAELAGAIDDAIAARVGLAGLAHAQGAWSDARRLLLSATELATEAGSAGARYWSFFQRGLAEFDRSDLASADQSLATALENAGDRNQRARVMGLLGNLDLRRGRLWDARAKYLEVYKAESEYELPMADVLWQLGTVHRLLGQPREALEYLKAALSKLAAPARVGDRVRVLGQMGLVYEDLGQARESEKSLLLARELASTQARSPLLEVESLQHLVRCYDEAGDLESALALQREALQKAQEHDFADMEALARANLGYLLWRNGDPKGALGEARAALPVLRAAVPPATVLAALDTIARAAIDEGDVAGAREAFAEAEAILQRPDIARGGIEQASVWRAQHAAWGEIAQDLTALEWRLAAPGTRERRDALQRGFTKAGEWKGRALLLGIAEHRQGLRDPAGAEIRRERRKLLERMEEARRTLARAIADARPRSELESLRESLRNDGARERDLVEQLREVSPSQAELEAPRGVSPEDVRASLLSERVALIEYVAGTQNLFAFVIGPAGDTLVDLGERAPVDAWVADYARDLASPSSPKAAVVEHGARVHRALIAPLEPYLAGVDSLYVVPCGALATLAFDALVVRQKESGEVVFLIDRWEVANGPSTPVLLALHATAPRQGQPRALIIADPVYEKLGRLGGTGEEGLAIAKWLIDKYGVPLDQELEVARIRGSAEIHTESFDLYFGEAATPARLRGNLTASTIVHLGAHAFVDKQEPLNTALVLSSAPGASAYVTVADVLEFHLDANLSVISACETATGALRSGEGLQSLARAFIFAGSRSVIATLWRVDDQWSAETMKDFYREYLGQLRPPSAALRAAKIARRTDRGEASDPNTAAPEFWPAHPYWWAGYVYFGVAR